MLEHYEKGGHSRSLSTRSAAPADHRSPGAKANGSLCIFQKTAMTVADIHFIIIIIIISV